MRLLPLVLLIACSAPPQPARQTPTNQVVAPRPIEITENLHPGAAVDPIRIGMPRAEVRQLLGTPTTEDEPSPDYDHFPDRGLEIGFDKEDLVNAIHVYSSERAGYETRARKAYPLVGSHGITWKSTYPEVIAALGAPVASGDLPYAPIPSKWIKYPGMMLDFVVANNHLFHIAVSVDKKNP